MLLPRFSIRTLLAVLTGIAVLSLLAGQALGGRAWALGVTVAALSVPAALVVQAGFFGVAMLFARLLGADEIVTRTSRGAVERTIPETTGEPSHIIDQGPQGIAQVLAFLLAWAAVADVGAQPAPTPVAGQPNIVGSGPGYFHLLPQAYGATLVGPAGVNNKPGFGRKSNLQLTVDMNWPGQYGYRPIAITFLAQRPSSADRQITFRFHAGWWGSQKAIVVEQQVELPAGTTEISTTFLAPQYVDWHTCGWEVFVDGQEDEELRGTDIGVNQQQSLDSGIAALTTAGGASATSISIAIQNQAGANVSLHTVLPGEMPGDWMHYSSLDLVVVPAQQLPQMAAENPRKVAALLRWVRSGGNLWLIRVGDDWRRLHLANRVLDDDGQRRRTRAADGLPVDRDGALGVESWRAVPLGEQSLDAVEGMLRMTNFDVGSEPRGMRGMRRRRGRATDVPGLPATSEQLFRVRPHGLGVVVAFPRELPTPAPGDAAEMGGGQVTPIISTSMLGPRSRAATRHGNMPSGGNAEFNNFLIPNVGVAPVGHFQFLISLFVLGIGPANYWWLRRRRKLPWLLVTTPVAAVVITSALLGYGMAADGFGVRVRARSLTLLDQAAGEAVSWARLSYYAGTSPRDGLVMPSDTALYPILPNWSDSYGYRRGQGREKVLHWRDGQRLTRGWLAPRTPTQYLAVTARPSRKRLDLRVTDDGLRIVNRLGVRVVQAAVQDHDGKMYWCQDLADGAGRILPPSNRPTIATHMRTVFSNNFPEFPPGAEALNYGGYYGYLLSQNLMEMRLEAINSPIVQDWGDGSYIAITDRGVELDLGVDPATEEASFHVIEGKW